MNKLVEILVRWSIHACAFHTYKICITQFNWIYRIGITSYICGMTPSTWKNPNGKLSRLLIYGVKSSGNQAECGLRRTAKLMEEGHPRVCEIIHKDIYVDDCISGENCPEGIRTTTDDLKLVLNRGGFCLKGVTISGADHPPPPNKNTPWRTEILFSLEVLSGYLRGIT